MDYTAIKKITLWAFIGFLGFTALSAIIILLIGEFGDLELKILGTSFTISAASILAMSCVAFIERKRLVKLGFSGILLSLVAAILLIFGMWVEIDRIGYWKTAITFVILSYAFAHAFILVLPKLDDRQEWVQILSSFSIGVLSLLIVVAVWGEIEDEGYYRFLAAVAIVVALETLVVPILIKLRKGNGEERKSLVLESIGGEMYKDSVGNVYVVRKTITEPGNGADADERIR
jgi:hypothetical protein